MFHLRPRVKPTHAVLFAVATRLAPRPT